LGLAARAGAVAAGTARVRERVRGGVVRLAIVAGDLTDTGRDKLIPLLEGKGVPYRVRYDRARLGGAVGKGPLSAVGVEDAGLAARLESLLEGE
jgi:ribosomal protein L7Ae-like RNA K-turn-binding protein